MEDRPDLKEAILFYTAHKWVTSIVQRRHVSITVTGSQFVKTLRKCQWRRAWEICYCEALPCGPVQTCYTQLQDVSVERMCVFCLSLPAQVYKLWWMSVNNSADHPTTRFHFPVLLLCHVLTIFHNLINYSTSSHSCQNKIPKWYLCKDILSFPTWWMMSAFTFILPYVFCLILQPLQTFPSLVLFI